MDWTSVLTVIATGLVTLAGVWVNGLITSASERRKSAAEQARFETANEREDAAAELKGKAQAKLAEASVAREIVEHFTEALTEVRMFPNGDVANFDTQFGKRWDEHFELELRQSVGSLLDGEGRMRLVAIMDALGDFQPLAPFSGACETRRFVDDTLTLGIELALAFARGQIADDKQSQRFDSLNQSLSDWDRFLEQNRKTSERRERELLEREAKEDRLDEMRYDAILDAATDAGLSEGI